MWKPGSDRPQDKKPKPSKKEDAAPMKSDGLPPRGVKKAPTKFVLSQKTLAMKFMQRKKVTNAQRVAAVQEQHRQDTWEAAPEDDAQDDDGSRVICTRDVPDPSLPLVFGRRSFGGFNKGVEDEFKEASRALRNAASEEKELREEVSAEEMTSRMLKYTGLGRRNGGNNRSGGGGKRPNGNKRQRK
ncbi:M-phase phosphoprotein 6 [Phytophthora cinnamomi]|uniref:M-phase phosphoprotein 6 n=1 Tax=Phytophthora cinnamomi TaxID=4785 RepID=UPI00355A16E2|nr:M-phase phosphoprotein 6 [Phytophthora cinnamomi]